MKRRSGAPTRSYTLLSGGGYREKPEARRAEGQEQGILRTESIKADSGDGRGPSRLASRSRQAERVVSRVAFVTGSTATAETLILIKS